MAYGTTAPILAEFDDESYFVVLTFNHALADVEVAADNFTAVWAGGGVTYPVSFIGASGYVTGTVLSFSTGTIGDPTSGTQRCGYTEDGLFLDSDGNSIHSFTIYDAIAKRSAHYAALRRD